MTAIANQKVQGYKGQLQYTPLSGAPATVLGLKDWELEIKFEELDATDHSTAGWTSTIPGLSTWSGTATLDYITGDTTQQALRTATLTSAPISLTLLPIVATGSGADEYTGSAYITSFKTGAKNNGLQSIEIAFKGNGQLVLGAQ